MASTRMTQGMRDSIIRRATNSTFVKEEEVVRKRVDAFLRRAYRQVVTAVQEKSLRQLSSDLPGFIKIEDEFRFPAPMPKSDASPESWESEYSALRLSAKDRGYPSRFDSRYFIVRDEELFEEATALHEELEAVDEMRNQLKSKVRRAVYTHSTLDKLAAAVPEMRAFMNDEWFTKYPPAVIDGEGLVSDLRRAGSLPVGASA